MIKRKLEMKLVKDQEAVNDKPSHEELVNNVALAQAAAINLGTKLVVGAIVVITTTILVKTISQATLIAVDNYTSK